LFRSEVGYLFGRIKWCDVVSTISNNEPFSAVDARPGHFEVLVYGGTPAGCFAAIAASRAGLRVLLVNPDYGVGGMVASGLSATDIISGTEELVVKGLAREFFVKCGGHYGRALEYRPEPRIARAVFESMLQESGVLLIRDEVVHAERSASFVAFVELASRRRIKFDFLVDATYEGDLLAICGLPFIIGREASAEFKERLAGRRPLRTMSPYPGSSRIELNSGYRLAGLPVSSADGLAIGDSDSKLPAMCFRLTLTSEKSRKVPFPSPVEYPPAFADFFRALVRCVPPQEMRINFLFKEVYGIPTFRSPFFNMAPIAGMNRDLNSGPAAPLDIPGFSNKWVVGSKAERDAIKVELREHTLRVLKFICSDSAVPARIRSFFSFYGLAGDQHLAGALFPDRPYVREGRRLQGEKMYTLDSLLEPASAASVALSRYPVDCKPAQWTTNKSGTLLLREGMLFFDTKRLYGIPASVMLPKRFECENFITPTALSVSHVCFSSLRVEPTFMQLGQVAGTMVALASRTGQKLHDLSASEVRCFLASTGY
jgi:hypothetical protein